ncbi:hypothetical protein T484DRAFT_1755107 [Baffinella frigidus]|nr:hypothetical protein T484DRAFT_1755107 [Cryptophyta sp. CCMP2293]
MSFFGNLNGGGIKGPDVVINGDVGSLLPKSSSGMRFSSAQINKQESLLGGVAPYSYGQGSVSDDISHQVTPHKIQKIVAEFSLPSAKTSVANDNITLCHGVSDGDLAFTIRLVHDAASRMKNYNYFEKQNITRAVDPIINLATVNYIMRGLQSDMGENASNWKVFLQATGWPVDVATFKPEDFRGGPHQHRNVSMFLQDYIRPLGVVIGSDMQGGQHQSGGTVDFPVDFVVTVLVDGLCDNMLNLWRRTEIRAGSDLLLALVGTQIIQTPYTPISTVAHTYKPVDRPVGVVTHQVNAYDGLHIDAYSPPQQTDTYVLNHWAQNQVSQTFDPSHKPGLLYEVVPTTSSEIDEGSFLGNDKRNRGLWHVARSQVHIRGHNMGTRRDKQTFRNDKANLAVGGLVQATIAPCWKHATRCIKTAHGTVNVPSVCHTPLSKFDIVTPPVLPGGGGGGGGGGVGGGGSDVHWVGGIGNKLAPMYIGTAIRKQQTNATPDSHTGNLNGTAKRKMTSIMGEPSDVIAASPSVVTESDTPKLRKVAGSLEASENMDVDSDMLQSTSGKTFARNITTGGNSAGDKTVPVVRVSSKKRTEARE